MQTTALIKRHPVLTYFALTFTISWGGVLFVIGRALGGGVKAQDNPLFPLALLAMVAGPSITGLLLTGLVHGKRGFREFGARLLKWRVGVGWYAIALLTAPLVAIVVAQTLSLFSPEFVATTFLGASKADVLFLGIVVGLAAGCFEELGWTGFVIPQLKRRHGVLATGLVVGLLWSAWHVLVVTWGIGGRAGTVPLPLFIIIDGLGALPAFRVLMVQVYDRTESLLVAILMHASLTATTIILTPQTAGSFLLGYGLVFAVVVWVVIAALAFVPGRRSLQGRTTPFLDEDGQPLADSIAEVAYRRIGGVDQWVMIRGENVANPPLIHLHGGPGFSEMRMFRHYNAPLEKIFTIVSWDQRGTAKSFHRDIPRSSMTVEQFLSDLDELVEYVRSRLGHDKVVIFGHSWGSVLGVLYARRYPHKVAAYVGSAQVGDWFTAESASYVSAVAEAQRRNNNKALRQLRALGPPPYDADSVMTERTWHERFAGHVRPRAAWTLARVLLGGPEASVADLPNIIRGFRFSLDTMWAEVSSMNLLKLAPALQVPAFFFLGRQDHWVPPETSVTYINVLQAPLKQLVWFERSAHEPFVDEADKFNAAMRELVRPVVRTSAPVRTHAA